MKILLIHHRIPYPSVSGMDKVSYNLIRALSKVHKLTLVIPLDEHVDTEGINEMSNYCDKLEMVQVKSRISAMHKKRFWYWWRFLKIVIGVPSLITENYYPQVARRVQQLSESDHFDIVQAISLASAEYLQFAAGSTTSVLLAHEVHSELARSHLDYQKKRKLSYFMGWLNYRAYLSYEPRAYLNSDWVLALSTQDLQRINALAGGLSHTSHLPVPVEPDDLQSPTLMPPFSSPEPHSLVFVGGLGPLFNQDAVLFFCKEIFPLILSKVPDAKFYVVGNNPPEHIKRLSENDQIVVTGEVPDVRPYVRRAAVYVAPVRFGAGLKTKMVEAMSLGKAIVSTSVGTAGLWDLSDSVLRICDDPAQFAKQVIELLDDERIRTSLGNQARDLFERSYSFKAVCPKVLEVYNEIEDSICSRPGHC